MVATAAERKAAERERRRKAGYKAFEVWVHLEDWPLVQRYLERLWKRRNGK